MALPAVAAKALKGLAKKVGNKALEGAQNAMANLAQKWFKIKVYLIAGAVVVVIACISALISAFTKSSSDSMTEAKTKVKSSVQSGTLAGDTGNAEQFAYAEELNAKYKTNIGYTLRQIEEMAKVGLEELHTTKSSQIYSGFKSTYGKLEDKDKPQIKEAYELLKKLGQYDNLEELNEVSASYLWYYNYTNEGKLNKNVISPHDKKSLYEHVLKTEKYNFNAINWLKVTHKGEGDGPIDRDKLYYDSSLGLLYPNQGGVDSKTFIEMTAPYMLANEIPSTFISSSAYNTTPNESLGTTVVQTFWDENEGVISHIGDFGYQILKHGLSDITINQYELENVTLNTTFEDYDIFNCTDEMSYRIYYKKIKEPVMIPGLNIQLIDLEGNPVYTERDEFDHIQILEYKDGSELINETTVPTGHFNSRTVDGTAGGEVDPKKEEPTDNNAAKSIGHTYKYKLISAIAFDVYESYTFEHIKYIDEDVDNRTNPASYSETPNPFDRITKGQEGNHITRETVYGFTDEGQIKDKFNVDDNVSPVYESETLYYYEHNNNKAKTSYSFEKGNKYAVKRFYSDTLKNEPDSTKKRLLGVADVARFDENKKNDPSMSTVKINDFKEDNLSVTYYTELSQKEKNALNTVDYINSNPKVVLNYMSTGLMNSTYLGYTRGSYAFSEAMKNLKSSFKEIASKNGDTLPWVYGASLGFDVNADPAPTGFGGGATSSLALLKEYLRSKEGHEGIADASGNKIASNRIDEAAYYYVGGVWNGKKSTRTVGYGVDLDTSGYEKQILEAMGRSNKLEIGELVPVEIVDRCEDDEISRGLKSVESTFEGIDLKEYQKHALVSRMYNCGEAGWRWADYSSSNKTIVQAYNTWWKPEVDDQYEALMEEYGADESNALSAVKGKTNFNHAMYLDYMNKPNNGGLLDTRRQSEWILFSQGYYDSLKKFWRSGGGTPGDINLYNSDGTINESACAELTQWFVNNLFSGEASLQFSGMGGYEHQNIGGLKHVINTTDYPFLSNGLEVFQCTWWARIRASLQAHGADESMDPGRYLQTSGNGREVAKNTAAFYNVPLNTSIDTLQPNSIISVNSSSKEFPNCGHVMYVEAVDYSNRVFYVSHCGGGHSWYGITKKSFDDFTDPNYFWGSVAVEDIVNSDVFKGGK